MKFFKESQTASFYKRLQTGGTIVTLLGHTMVGSSFPYVIQSYDLGVRRGIQYLLKRCNGSIAFVKNNIWLGRNMVQEVMEETYKTTLKNKNSEGRKLNFLLQEMNGEANTIGAKALSAEISHLVVQIKDEVEKIREQVQNIE